MKTSFILLASLATGSLFAANLTGDGYIYLTQPGTSYTPPTSATGNRFLWYADKGAFQFGQNDQSAIGDFSFAGGESLATGDYAFAYGGGAQATGNYATGLHGAGHAFAATGIHGTASGVFSIAFGYGAVADADYSLAIFGGNAGGEFSIAMGQSATASSEESLALGSWTTSTGYASTVLGNSSLASGTGATALGYTVAAKADYSAALGSFVSVDAQYGLAVGRYNLNIQKNGSTQPSHTILSDNDPIFEVGNGTADTTRANAFTLFRDGTTRFTGPLELATSAGAVRTTLTTAATTARSVVFPDASGTLLLSDGAVFSATNAGPSMSGGGHFSANAHYDSEQGNIGPGGFFEANGQSGSMPQTRSGGYFQANGGYDVPGGHFESNADGGAHGGSFEANNGGGSFLSNGNPDLGFWGGSFISNALTADGGSVTLSNGGGSINTTGTGSIQLGVSSTRTTLTGTATAPRAIAFPDASGTVLLNNGSGAALTNLNPGNLSGEVSLSNGGTGVALTDPNVDRILFWDDSTGSMSWLTAGTGLSISGSTISVNGGESVLPPATAAETRAGSSDTVAVTPAALNPIISAKSYTTGVGGFINLDGLNGSSGESANGGAFISRGMADGSVGGVADLSGGTGGDSWGGNLSLTGGTGYYTLGGSLSANGGSIDFATAGNLNLDGGTLPGGSITMNNGAGSINLTGAGSIEFGVSGTRTTLVGSATADRTLTLPDTTGTLLVANSSGTSLTNLNASALVSGTVSAARGGAGDVTGLLKADGAGNVSAAVAGTDYMVPGGGTSITTVGTVTTGTWSAVTIAVNKGGTGAASLTGLVVGNGTAAFTTVTAPAGEILGTSDTQTITNKTLSGASNTFTNIPLATAVTGTLPNANLSSSVLLTASDLDASKLTTGTVADARLSTRIVAVDRDTNGRITTSLPIAPRGGISMGNFQ